MTEPKEHCEHERVCKDIWHFAGHDIPCIRGGCKNDTRFRPHTPASEPAGCPRWRNNECKATWGLVEEEARKHERERVLKDVSESIEHQKDHKEFLLPQFYKDVVLDIIDGIREGYKEESLRESGEE